MTLFRVSDIQQYEEIYYVEADSQEEAENKVDNGEAFNERYTKYDEHLESRQVTEVSE